MYYKKILYYKKDHCSLIHYNKSLVIIIRNFNFTCIAILKLHLAIMIQQTN